MLRWREEGGSSTNNVELEGEGRDFEQRMRDFVDVDTGIEHRLCPGAVTNSRIGPDACTCKDVRVDIFQFEESKRCPSRQRSCTAGETSPGDGGGEGAFVGAGVGAGDGAGVGGGTGAARMFVEWPGGGLSTAQ